MKRFIIITILLILAVTCGFYYVSSIPVSVSADEVQKDISFELSDQTVEGQR